MSDASGGGLAQRETDRWRYSLDMSAAPAYGLCTLEGEPGQDMIERVAADLLRLTDALIGPEAPVCPMIVDLRKLTSGKIGAATFQWASSRALRRMTRLVVVFDGVLLTKDAYSNFMRLATMALPNVEIAYSLEEAFERLGLEPPEGTDADAP